MKIRWLSSLALSFGLCFGCLADDRLYSNVENDGSIPSFSVFGSKDGDAGVESLVFRIISVVNESEFIGRLMYEEEPAVLHVKHSKSIRVYSDDTVQLSGLFKALPPYNYTTAIGAKNTVRSIEFVAESDVSKVLKSMASVMEENKKILKEERARKNEERRKEEEKKRLADFRTFTSADGKFKVFALFLGVKAETVGKESTTKVILEKENGEQKIVNLNLLSAEDIKWVRAQLKAKADAKKQADLDAKLLSKGYQKYSQEWIAAGGSKPKDPDFGPDSGGGFSDGGVGW